MQICLMIEGQEGVTWEQWRSLAIACEEHGFHGLFRSDHYLSFEHPHDRGALDAWTTLSALAALTSRIRLGSMVSPVTFRHPALLAKAVITADHVSGGRVELGIGAGWFEREHRAYGFPFPPTGDRMDHLTEQVEIVHRLWSRDEEEVSFTGRHYQLEACPSLPKGVQEPHPPLVMGGGAGPRSAALAARWADEYDVVYVDPPTARDMGDRVVAACEAIGRDPGEVPLSVMTRTLVGSDEPELLQRAKALMATEGESGDVDAFVKKIRSNQIAGTVDQVLERLQEFAAVGVQRVYLQHLVHDDLDSVALIGKEIIPEAAGF
jgi:F420-dependent oxidoreductase-like protein